MNRFAVIFAFSIIAVLLVAYSHTAHADSTHKNLEKIGDKTKLKKTIPKIKPRINYSAERKIKKTDLSSTYLSETPKPKKIDKSGFKKAPALQGITGYINTSPDEIATITKNKVVLYDFWTYSCYNCKNTIPYIKSWYDKYSDKGLVIIGIHYPEFDFERDASNVKQAVANNGIKFPVVQDNDGVNWDAFDNHYWPRFYLADSEGYIRYDHIGEGDYDVTENMIRTLLQESNS